MTGLRTFAYYRFLGTFRFLLAAMVVFHHFAANAAPLPLTLLLRPYEVGSLAVLVFFCVSGFVIVEAAQTIYQNRPAAFMSNRLIRLFPHFLSALIMSVALQGIFSAIGILRLERMSPPHPDFSIGNLLMNLVGIIPPADKLTSYEFIEIAWAVRIEMTFYLVVAVSLLISSRYSRFRFSAVLLMVLGGLLPTFVYSLFRTAPPTFGFIAYFAYGGALYYAVQGSKVARLVAVACIAGMFAHFVAQPNMHPVFDYQRNLPVQLAILALLIVSFSALAMVNARRFQAKDNQIGSVTYPLYMYHLVVLVAFASWFANPSYLTFLVGMATSVALATVMTRILDPLIDRYRDRIRGRRLVETAKEQEIAAVAA